MGSRGPDYWSAYLLEGTVKQHEKTSSSEPDLLDKTALSFYRAVYAKNAGKAPSYADLYKDTAKILPVPRYSSKSLPKLRKKASQSGSMEDLMKMMPRCFGGPFFRFTHLVKRHKKAASRTFRYLTRQQRAAMLKEGARNYRALLDLVRERDGCYDGPEDKRRWCSGEDILLRVRRKFLHEESLPLHLQHGTAAKFCERALSRLAKAPLRPDLFGEIIDPDDFDNPQEYFGKLRTVQDSECAKTALACYNMRNPGAEHELVEPIKSNVFINEKGSWYHVNFRAKPKTSAASDSGDASPKLFFAELNFTQDTMGYFLALNCRLICRCCIADTNISETTPCCRFCYDNEVKVYHVKGNFRFGQFEKARR